MSLPTENVPVFATVPVATVTREILDLVRAEVGAVDVIPSSDLQSLGLDSLKVMALVFKIEARYDIHLDEEDADDLSTVGDLADLVVLRIQESR